MKTFSKGLLTGSRTRGSIWILLVALLVWAWPARAAEKQAVEIVAYYLAVDWGQASATPSDNIHVTDLGATCMMVSDNPLLTGQLTWVGIWNGDAELNGGGAGTGVFDIGTWDLSSGAPMFIPSPTGGQWVTKWEMTGNPSSSYAGKVIAHGVAGEVTGMMCVLAAQGGGGVDYYRGELLDPEATPNPNQPVERPFKSEATVTWTVKMADGSATGHHTGVATQAGVWTSDCSAVWDLVNYVIVSATGVSIAADGDQIFWKMTQDQPMVVQFTGGTGRFENATGLAPTAWFMIMESAVDPSTGTLTMTIDYRLEGTITY